MPELHRGLFLLQYTVPRRQLVMLATGDTPERCAAVRLIASPSQESARVA
jgi:hypothetical protein